MFLLGLILAVAYVPGWTGFALPTGYLFLSAVLPFVLWQDCWKVLNPLMLYALASLAWTPVWQQGVNDAWRLGVLSACFVLGYRCADRDFSRFMAGLGVGVSASTLVAITQALNWHLVPWLHDATCLTCHTYAGLLWNPNMLGESATLVAASSLPWVAVMLPALVLSGSRAAILALALATTLERWGRAVVIVPFAAALLIYSTWAGRKAEANIGDRLAIWSDTIAGLTWFGRGAGSFMITYPLYSSIDTGIQRPEDAHNDFLQLTYQYGLGALVMVPILWAALSSSLAMERRIIIVFLTLAFFGYPMSIPTEGAIGAFALGRCWRARPVVRGVWSYGRSYKMERVAAQ